MREHFGRLESFPPYVGGDDDEISEWQGECSCGWRAERKWSHVAGAYDDVVKHLNEQFSDAPESKQGQWDRPEHYGGEENPFEAIKIIEHYDLNFNLGSVVKYVLRAPFKGTPLSDLKKAYTYVGFEIRKRERAGETE
jgi:hypothetical protein